VTAHSAVRPVLWPAATVAAALIAAVTGAMIVAGIVLEVSFVVANPGEIPAARVVSFAYLIPAAIAFTVVNLAVVGRLPRHPIGWLLAALALEGGTAILSNGYTSWDLTGSDWVTWVWAVVRGPAFAIMAMALLLFPTGRPPSPRWRWLLRVEQAYLAVAVVVAALAPWEIQPYPNQTYAAANPVGLFGEGSGSQAFDLLDSLGALLVVASLMALVGRWRTARGVERQQVKWIAVAALVFGFEALAGVGWLLSGAPTAGSAAAFVVGDAIFQLALTAIPVAMGIGIVRYRLFDVDRLISRMIVFGALAAFLAAAYVVGVVVAGQALTGSGSSTLVGLVVTAAVAVAFHPLRSFVQTLVDRWVFGARAAPYELMVGFGRELAGVAQPADALERIALAAGQAARSEGAEASVTLPNGQVLSTLWGDQVIDRVVVPVVDDGRTIGEIAVSGSSRLPHDVAVLDRIVEVSTAAMRNVRLLADLEDLVGTIEEKNRDIATSRLRLTVSAEHERRHLRHVVAERLDPRLADLRDVLPALRQMAHDRPHLMARSCASLAAQAAQLVEEIRAVSRGVMPPVLADHGLAAALRSSVRRLAVDTTLEIGDAAAMARFPAHIEAAAFLGCQAAIDAAASAGASQLAVRVDIRRDRLCFSVIHPCGDGLPGAGAANLLTARDLIASLGGELALHDDHRFGVDGALPLDDHQRDAGVERTGVGPAQPTSLRKVSTA